MSSASKTEAALREFVKDCDAVYKNTKSGRDALGLEWPDLADTLDRARAALAAPADEQTITIVVEGGCVVTVEDLPDGMNYVITDHDIFEEEDSDES